MIQYIFGILTECEPYNKRDNFLSEPYWVFKEAPLNPEDALEIEGTYIEGSFSIENIHYEYKIELLTDSRILEEIDIKGPVYNIIFKWLEDNPDDPENERYEIAKLYIRNIYSTIYKIILNFCKEHNPEYISLISPNKEGYYRSYSEMIKRNKIPGYSRNRVIAINYTQPGGIMGILLKRNNNTI